MYKSQLQEYAQRSSLPAPVYDITKEGPSHDPRFKASVTIQGETYESPGFFRNLKKAEHAAAAAALAAISNKEDSKALPGPLHESGLCKNLLQEYAQKCKLPLPIYTLEKSGQGHLPMFSATVEIAGVRYQGGLCRNKKEAEIKAAKTALLTICSDPATSFTFQNLEKMAAPAPASPPAKNIKPGPNHRNKRNFNNRWFQRRNNPKFNKGEDSANGKNGQGGTMIDIDVQSAKRIKGEDGQTENLDNVAKVDGYFSDPNGPSLFLSGNTEIPGIGVNTPFNAEKKGFKKKNFKRRDRPPQPQPLDTQIP